MKEKMQKKRQAILEAALLVFTQNGYDKTKIIDVAKTAGVGKGTVYEYFESKEELFRCILDEYCDLYQRNVTDILQRYEKEPVREKILAVMNMEEDLRKQVHLRSLNPLQLMREFSNFPGLKQAVQDMLQFKYDTVGHLLKEGGERGEFRSLNVPLATIALMGASSAVEGLVDSDTILLEGISSEALLDLLIGGFGA